MKPLNDRVLIGLPEDDIETATVDGGGASVLVESRRIDGSSLHKPGREMTVQTKPTEGIVMAIGEAVKIPIKEGDRVLFRAWTGIGLKLNGRESVITEERNVLAVTESGDEIEINSGK